MVTFSVIALLTGLYLIYVASRLVWEGGIGLVGRKRTIRAFVLGSIIGVAIVGAVFFEAFTSY